MSVPAVEVQIAADEDQYILEAWHDFRRTVQQSGDAEMRISVTLDRKTRQPEIIFAAFFIKRSLDTIRRSYALRRSEPHQRF